MTGIDWKRELRKIEREFDGLPPEPSPAEVRAKRAAERRELQRKEERKAKIGVWVRLVLVTVLGIAMLLWPYSRTCGRELFTYLGAGAMVTIGGLWVATITWRLRMARIHGVAMLIAFWGVVLLGNEVLLRTGYARVDPVNPPTWWCGPGR
ncbi:MAG TPA: hypothetical protein VF178_04000 [Gemmatimonadaceae bacterium]